MEHYLMKKYMRVSLIRELNSDLITLIPKHIWDSLITLDKFGDVEYTYICDDTNEIGDIVVVPMRSTEVIGRIEKEESEILQNIEYKSIIRKVNQ